MPREPWALLNRTYGDFMTSPLYRRIFDALNPPERKAPSYADDDELAAAA